MSFSKLLVANRGEIACRVMRTARALGLRTVAVYSDADADAPHVRDADEAVRIGAPPAAASYLHIAAIIAAAQASGADAVHPGYGFLSERAEFADACAQAGIVFVGPPAAAICAMGDKAAAKQRMRDAGVPCVPGYDGGDQTEERFQGEARRIGFPLLVKAVAGGGGRGMRIVREPSELGAALTAARREAESAFGDGTLMLERFVERSRHIEIQVFADAHGHAIHLGERDCTTQRRRQKVIEEAPSPVLTPAQREAIGRDAVAAAQAVGYVGAGTVEFIVDAQGRHFFLEMNTRLQVEHPVTEAVTGIDLVAWQLRVAAGEPLPLTQADVRTQGHAIEARLYAEDPAEGFAPQTGRVLHWRPEARHTLYQRPEARCTLYQRPEARRRLDEHPQTAGDVRIDAGIVEGGTVTPYYDAMLAKFVAHGATRDEAVRKLRAALAATPLIGLRSNARFLAELLAHESFTRATLHTATLDEWAAGDAPATPLLQRAPVPEALWQLAAAAIGGAMQGRPLALRAQTLTLQCNGETRRIALPVAEIGIVSWCDRRLSWHWQGVLRHTTALAHGGVLYLAHDAEVFAFAEDSPWPADASAADPGCARAPVAGVVAQVLVQPGQRVASGAPLVSVEAMKMEMWVHAAAAGTVRAVHVNSKQGVASGALLVELDIEA